uniref:Uncharacterized protein n=1 Tax=Micrurus surinamensis TaxID=129470 RepID=A0A2D4Q2I9_MICSU
MMVFLQVYALCSHIRYSSSRVWSYQTPHQKGDDLENQQDPANNAELFSAHVLDNCPSHFCSAFSPALCATAVAAAVKVKAAKGWEGREEPQHRLPGKARTCLPRYREL